jgi:hypothetical protein
VTVSVAPQQVIYVSAGTGSYSTSNPTPAYPSSFQAGDLILLQVAVMDVSNTPTTPSGFTILYGPDQSGTNDDDRGRQWIYYKFASGSETGTLTITIGGSELKLARMYAFRNVAPTSFNEGGSFLSDNDDVIDAPSVATTGDRRLAVAFVFLTNDYSVGSFTGETGGDWGEAISEFMTDTSDDGCIQLQIATMATMGTISGGNYDTGSNNVYWGVRAFALKPQ